MHNMICISVYTYIYNIHIYIYIYHYYTFDNDASEETRPQDSFHREHGYAPFNRYDSKYRKVSLNAVY